MRIVEETPDRLVLEDRPVLFALGYALAVLAMFAVALFAAQNGDLLEARALGVAGLLALIVALAIVRRTVVSLDGRQRQVTIRRSGVLRRTVAEVPLATVRGAEIQSRRPLFAKRLRKVHRPALTLTDGNQHVLVPLYASGPGAGRAVQAIRRWLEAHRGTG